MLKVKNHLYILNNATNRNKYCHEFDLGNIDAANRAQNHSSLAGFENIVIELDM